MLFPSRHFKRLISVNKALNMSSIFSPHIFTSNFYHFSRLLSVMSLVSLHVSIILSFFFSTFFSEFSHLSFIISDTPYPFLLPFATCHVSHFPRMSLRMSVSSDTSRHWGSPRLISLTFFRIFHCIHFGLPKCFVSSQKENLTECFVTLYDLFTIKVIPSRGTCSFCIYIQ